MALPKRGGDTQFVNMYEAYDALPEELKRRIVDLQAIKANTASESFQVSRRNEGTLRRGRLFIRSSERIQRQAARRSTSTRSMLKGLQKFQYRHKWKAGDVVVWDNRCLMHKQTELPSHRSPVSIPTHAQGRSPLLSLRIFADGRNASIIESGQWIDRRRIKDLIGRRSGAVRSIHHQSTCLARLV